MLNPKYFLIVSAILLVTFALINKPVYADFDRDQRFCPIASGHHHHHHRFSRDFRNHQGVSSLVNGQFVVVLDNGRPMERFDHRCQSDFDRDFDRR